MWGGLVGGGGGGVRVGRGVQDGCERGIEVFVKIHFFIFFWGGGLVGVSGVGFGGGGSGQGGRVGGSG